MPRIDCQNINLSFEQLDSKTGLGAAYNEFIYKDSYGFTWISSIGGLYRYDGLEMEVYQPDSTGMLGSNIQSPFFEDSRGNIWFSTTKAMNCYVRSQDTIFSRRFRDSNGLPIDQHYSIFHLENDSIIWTKAGKSLYTYNINSREECSIADEVQAMRFAVDVDTNGLVQNIYACPWDYGSGFYRLSRGTNFKPETLLKYGIPGFSKSSVEVSGALVQNRDSVWFFTPQGLVLFQPNKPLDEQFDHFPVPSPYEKNSLIGGALIKNKLLAIGIKNAGLWFFNIEKASFYQPSIKEVPQLNRILDLRCIYVDDEDHLWISPWDGAQVQRSWLYNNAFSNPFESLEERLPVVNSVVADQKQNVWSATVNNGIYIFDQDGGNPRHIPYSKEFKSIKQLSPAPNGEIWAINDKYIFKCKPELQKFEKAGYADNLTLFRLIHLSASQKVLTTSRGVYEVKVNTHSDTLDLKASSIMGDTLLPSFQIFQGDKGYIYLPDNAGDLRAYRWNKQEFEALDTLELGTEIYDVVEDAYSKNILWVGTLKGLLKVDIESGKVEQPLQYHEFLSDAKILGIGSDDKRQLWLATNLGLLCSNPAEEEVYHYQIEDGLASHDFSLFSNTRTSNGHLWFGTNIGAIVFHPDSITPNRIIPKPFIKSLQINQELVGVERFGGHISNFQEIQLRPSERSIDMEIVALSSYWAKHNKVSYKLENHEEDWKGLETGKALRFINLDPGEYRLKVRTENSNGVSVTADQNLLTFEIAPYPYERREFWPIIIIVIGGVLWTVSRSYYNRKLRKQEERAEHKRQLELREMTHKADLERKELEYKMELERKEFERKQTLQKALDRERNRIAAEMHDDLGGGLTAIRLLIKKTLRGQLNDKTRVYIKKVEKYATDSVESMGEIIWAMNSNYDNLRDLVAYIRRYIAEMLDENEIEYHANIDEDLPGLIIAGKKRRNIFLTIKEALHNTIKHSKAKLVTLQVHVDPVNQELVIIFHDNGIGIQQNLNEFGNGLSNIQGRMKDINAKVHIQNDGGTKICLKIPIGEKNQPSLQEA